MLCMKPVLVTGKGEDALEEHAKGKENVSGKSFYDLAIQNKTSNVLIQETSDAITQNK